MFQRKAFLFVAIAALLVTGLSVTARPAYAFSVNLVSVTCSAVTVSFTTTDPDVYELHSHAYDPSNNELIANTDNHYIALSGAGTYTFTIPFSTPQPDGTVIEINEIHLHSSGGPDDYAIVAYGYYPCSEGFAGRGIPAGFELRTITCDVAVFDKAAGQPVGDNRIKAGQTWYVNPETTTTAGGESWSEVFVSGLVNGWIPSRCVN